MEVNNVNYKLVKSNGEMILDDRGQIFLENVIGKLY